MAQQLCRHKGCTCAARADGYCSDACAAGTDADASEPQPCLCGHDECQAPTKPESLEAVADLAPPGRFIKDYKRDW